MTLGEWNLTNRLPISISKYSCDIYLFRERQIKGELCVARDPTNHDQAATGERCLTTQVRPDLTSKTTNREKNILEKTGFKFDHPDRLDWRDIKGERALKHAFWTFMFAALCPLLVEVLKHFAANNVKNYATASHSFHNFVCEQII